ncbi:MAG: DUF1214 domain-containing protein [bacterium]|nr:hypothetical protein [Deltaproteobacteria bacterium]MCP4908268.1 DUF1214 domain-containing protein [bacterium]
MSGNRSDDGSAGEVDERLASGQAWRDFCDTLKEAGDEILAAAPSDDFDRAEGYRYLARITSHFLRSSLDESDPAKSVLSTTSPKIGLDNPDYVYASARLSPRYVYKLTGRMNDVALLGIGAFSGALGTPTGLVRDHYVTTNELEMEQGRFELLISREEQPGNWLPMGDQTNSLSIRQTVLRRREEKPASLELARVDAGERPAPLDPANFVQTVDRVGLMVSGIVGQFLAWTASFQEHPFEIREIDPKFLATAQGDPNTTYHYSYWELADDEVYSVVLEPPERFDYWNLQIGNHWLESFDYHHYDTHVNHETAVLEKDGKVRISISARDPGRPNWLDTAGHRRGALALRWVGADSPPPRPRVSVDKISTTPFAG